MKTLLFGLTALPFLAGVALAAEPLKDAQMDQITGGATCPAGFTCTSSTVGTTMTTFGCLSGPDGCNGQVFTPTSPQTFFKDVNDFLKLVGFKPGP